MMYAQHQPSVPALTLDTLREENTCYCHSGGVSQNNGHAGFRSAFLDLATGRAYLSCFANGNPAPIHLLDGLPDELVRERSVDGRILAIKETVVAGFLRAEMFYTREQAAQWLAGH